MRKVGISPYTGLKDKLYILKFALKDITCDLGSFRPDLQMITGILRPDQGARMGHSRDRQIQARRPSLRAIFSGFVRFFAPVSPKLLIAPPI